MRIIKIDSHRPDAAIIAQAVAALREGQVLAYLTDTMYGLGVDPRNGEAVARLYALKQRAPQKAIPLIVGSKEMLADWIKNFPPLAEKLAEHFWPGPLTMIFHAHEHAPPQLSAGTNKIAMRVPDSVLARELSSHLGAPITSTSANLSGDAAVLAVDDIVTQLGHEIDLVLDSGTVIHTSPSTIIDVTTAPPRLVRPGVIAQQAVEKIIGVLAS
ncbi:MAG: L-threonylcarbamoyladenylate synthase [candidate division KSB1 bacterium]